MSQEPDSTTMKAVMIDILSPAVVMTELTSNGRRSLPRMRKRSKETDKDFSTQPINDKIL